MKYKVEKVYSNSEHPMATKVEDEEDIFIIDDNGNYYPASEFFYMVSICEFRTKE